MCLVYFYYLHSFSSYTVSSSASVQRIEFIPWTVTCVLYQIFQYLSFSTTLQPVRQILIFVFSSILLPVKCRRKLFFFSFLLSIPPVTSTHTHTHTLFSFDLTDICIDSATKCEGDSAITVTSLLELPMEKIPKKTRAHIDLTPKGKREERGRWNAANGCHFRM